MVMYGNGSKSPRVQEKRIIPDLYHSLQDKEKFKEIMIGLFINKSV